MCLMEGWSWIGDTSVHLPNVAMGLLVLLLMQLASQEAPFCSLLLHCKMTFTTCLYVKETSSLLSLVQTVNRLVEAD